MQVGWALLLLGACAAQAEAPPAAVDVWAEWTDRHTPVADGFQPPVDAGWTRTGEGSWRRASAGAVQAPALGVVRRASGDTLVIEHVFYENAERVTVTSTLHGDGPWVSAGAAGDRVEAGAVIGRGAQVEWSLRRGAEEVPVEAFLRAHEAVPVPQREAALAVVDAARSELRLYRRGQEAARYRVGRGQADGPKERRGDNRTPVGMYFVVAKSTGPFEGPVADYYGGYWTKLNYPNPWDAERGLAQGWVTAEQAGAISRAWRRRGLTLQDTRLGGGIGFHGWISEWSDADGPRKSWGCVVNHLSDVAAVYAALPVGAMVILR